MDCWLVMTGEKGKPGIDGGLMRKEAPAVSTTDTLGMPSVDDFTEENYRRWQREGYTETADARRGIFRLLQGHREESSRHYGERPERQIGGESGLHIKKKGDWLITNPLVV